MVKIPFINKNSLFRYVKKKKKNSNSTCLLVFFQIVKATLSQCLLVLTCEYSCCSPYKKHLEILLTKNYAFNFFF